LVFYSLFFWEKYFYSSYFQLVSIITIGSTFQNCLEFQKSVSWAFTSIQLISCLAFIWYQYYFTNWYLYICFRLLFLFFQLTFMFYVKTGILENHRFILFSKFVFDAYCLYTREVNLTFFLYVNLWLYKKELDLSSLYHTRDRGSLTSPFINYIICLYELGF